MYLVFIRQWKYQHEKQALSTMSDTKLELHKHPLKEKIDHQKLMQEWHDRGFAKRPFPKEMTAAELQEFAKHPLLAAWLETRLGRKTKDRHKDELHEFIWCLFVNEPYSKCGCYHFYVEADLDRIMRENTLYWIDDFVSGQFEKWWSFLKTSSISVESFYDIPTTLHFQGRPTYEEKVLAIVKYVNIKEETKWKKKFKV